VKYFSMFSGIGGFELGIQNAYEIVGIKNLKQLIEVSHAEQLLNEVELRGCRQAKSELETIMSMPECKSYFGQYPTCIGYSEVDKYAVQIYERHFGNQGWSTLQRVEWGSIRPDGDKPNAQGGNNEQSKTRGDRVEQQPQDNRKGHKNYGDCTKINWSTVEDFDLLVGGFPCQAFSIAGKRGGFKDTRGTLFFEIARCLKEKQPCLFLLENVKGLLSHDKGTTFLTILTTLDELGYDCQWQVLNSKNFGVPQNRERVFIVGHLRGTSRPEVFPIGEGFQENNGEVSKTINSSDWLGLNRNQEQTMIYQRPHGFNKGNLKEKPSLRSSCFDKNDFLLNGTFIRRLTPTECERLQGFPDGWTEGISDTQRYKCLGNAVTVNVIEAIMERILTKRGDDE